ncbi:MAG: hypothetical protein RIQ52_672 [Pseudomonadota bacterium]
MIRYLQAIVSRAVLLSLLLAVTGCGDRPNDPYPENESAQRTLYSGFAERPKHLDPARAYSADEYQIIAQIYEPLFQYAYLKRPYQLEPLTAAGMPDIIYRDRQGRVLPDNAAEADIATTDYVLTIRPGILYQPHPALAKDGSGAFLYHHLDENRQGDLAGLADFPVHGTRELKAEDYLYQIKRLVHPALHSPVAELMKEHIVGLKTLAEQLERSYAQQGKGFLDLRAYPLEGVEVLGDYQFRIRLAGKYPQFRFWLAMPFFAPMPWEADVFYAQPLLLARNISLDWFPLGTGPYQLTENNPNRRMVLERNPHHHEEFYPSEGEPGDEARGYLRDQGTRLPIIDRVVMSLEKETIPYWNKFLQGYYDFSGLASDNFDQAVQFSGQGSAELTPEMQARGIQLETAVATSLFYLGFNMQDPVVGGLDEAHCRLRQAISIAIDYEEFISIFMNGRGVAAQGILPPGIFGYQEGEAGINRYVYDWQAGRLRRKSIEEARQLMRAAGYPDGVDQQTGQPLVLYLDTTARGPDDKSLLNWYRKQFARLGIQLVIRATDYNQFQQKMSNGNAQIYQWGWNADYPDPENFFFLLYGPNAKKTHGGENASNYVSPEFDHWFEAMRNMDDGPSRIAIIERLQSMIRHDAPWVFGFHPRHFTLHHQWYQNIKPNLMANNELKYQRIDAGLRASLQKRWNQPHYLPVLLLFLLALGIVMAGVYAYRRRLEATAL